MYFSHSEECEDDSVKSFFFWRLIDPKQCMNDNPLGQWREKRK